LFGAGREKKIYAIPPHTEVVSLAFEDVPFEKESFEGKKCRLCGSSDTYLDEIFDRGNQKSGGRFYQCSDSSYCQEVRSHVSE
jgi:alpha-D-ribose 1-methylphosphonate 5-phosphate C-P lyase